MSKLAELRARLPKEAQEQVDQRVVEMRREITLRTLRKELEISQVNLARSMGVTQPSVVKMEREDSDPKLSTLKRYVSGLGGELNLEVSLPDGRRITLSL